jgi:mannosyltransferase
VHEASVIDPAAETSGWHFRRVILSWLVLIVPAIAELLVGGYGIGRASLWRDEGYTREVIRRPIGGIIALLGHQDAVHALYYVGMHLIGAAVGTSVTAIRLPSLIAAALAAGLTAALGRQLAGAAARPAADATGLLAGLLLVALPLTTWYAQDARPYAMATLCAVGATYLLVRAVAAPSRWWWAAYGAVIVILALLNLTALLLIAAHGVSLLVLRARIRPGERQAMRQLQTGVRRWLVAAAAALAALSPLIVLAARQGGRLSWVTRPDGTSVASLIIHLAGGRDLIPLVAGLALAGAAADAGRHRRVAWPPASITVPWLVLPPGVLLAVSELRPVYVERYVVFVAPALALLTASGLVWLVRLARLTAAGRRWPALAVVPSALLLAIMAAALVAPQQAARLTAARPDDLRKVAAIIGRHERPGDAVLYMPWETRTVSLAYPRPFRSLRDIGQLESPIVSATLAGTPASPALLGRRFASVPRLWTVCWRRKPPRPSPLFREQQALLGRMHLSRRWRIKSVVLSLYVIGR